MNHAVILGAGLAGLRAATILAKNGVRVTLLERGSTPGGRIRRIASRDKTETLDWGQHLMLGAYTHLLAFASELGTRHRLRPVMEPTPFVTPDGRHHAYRVSRLPAPLHGLPGLFHLTQLSKRERLLLPLVAVAAKAECRLRPEALDRCTAKDWLHRLEQSENACRSFWEPLVLATLNTPLSEASAYLLATVVDRGMFSRAEHAVPYLPETTWHDALVEPVLQNPSPLFSLRLNTTARWLQHGPTGFRVGLNNGECLETDTVVSTLAPWDLRRVVEYEASDVRLDLPWERFQPSPIVSVELWYDRQWFAHPYAGLLGTESQWVFSHAPAKNGGPFRISVVISAAESLHGNAASLARHVHNELRGLFPECRNMEPTDFMVLRETKATMRQPTGLQSHRPKAQTAVPGFLLAGDWTATGLPATMESAVQSGCTAAHAVLRYFSSPRS